MGGKSSDSMKGKKERTKGTAAVRKTIVHPDRTGRILDPSACTRLLSSLLLQVTSWIHFQQAEPFPPPSIIAMATLKSRGAQV